MQRVDAKYVELSKRYGLTLRLEHSEQGSESKFSIKTDGHECIIVIHDALIEDGQYEPVLAYAVSEVLLPRVQIQTERLIIRRFDMKDAQACFAFLSDVDGMLRDGCKPFAAMNEEYWERMSLFEQRSGQYVITLADSGEVVGTINVFSDDSRVVESKEIGYAVSPAHQRKGYAFEAISAVVRLLQKELHLDMVVAGVLPDNLPSIKLLEKLGFTREGLRHKALWHEGLDRPVDLVYYYMDRE